MRVRVAASAVVEETATIGSDSVVWDLTQVRAGASIGSGCTLGRNVFVDAGVRIGDACKIQNNALLYAPAMVGDGVFIGPAAVLTNDRYPRAVTPDGRPKSGTDWSATGVTVGRGASIGAGAVVIGGVSIGEWAMVAAGAVVATDVPPYALVAGVPARWRAWVGPAGEPLVAEGDATWRCPSTGASFVESDGRLRLGAGS